MSKWISVTRLFVAAMVVGFFATTVMAKDVNEPNKGQHKMREQSRPAKDPVEMRLEGMTKRLDLTKTQQDSIKPILQDEMKQMQALRADQSIAPEQRRLKMQEINQAANTKIEVQLTPEQKEKFKKQQEMMKDRRAEMREKHQGKASDSNSVKK